MRKKNKIRCKMKPNRWKLKKNYGCRYKKIGGLNAAVVGYWAEFFIISYQYSIWWDEHR